MNNQTYFPHRQQRTLLLAHQIRHHSARATALVEADRATNAGHRQRTQNAIGGRGHCGRAIVPAGGRRRRQRPLDHGSLVPVDEQLLHGQGSRLSNTGASATTTCARAAVTPCGHCNQSSLTHCTGIAKLIGDTQQHQLGTGPARRPGAPSQGGAHLQVSTDQHAYVQFSGTNDAVRRHRVAGVVATR